MTLTGQLRPDVSAAAYHADVITPEPALSASTAHVLLTKSPLHARHNHPRLGGRTLEETQAMQEGSAAHSLLFGEAHKVAVLHFENFKKDIAKKSRDDARAEGKIPVLVETYERLVAMTKAAREQWHDCADLAGYDITEGAAEQTITWQERVDPQDLSRVIWCKSRLDWLARDRRLIVDFKTTAQSAEPSKWKPWDHGADLQAAFYPRGNARTGGPPSAVLVFLVCETEEPFACSFVSLAPSALSSAEARMEEAMRVWGRCLKTGTWPAYPNRITYRDEPAWITREFADRLVMEEVRSWA